MANPQVTSAAVVSAALNTIRVNFDQPMRQDDIFYNLHNWSVTGKTVIAVASTLGASVAVLTLGEEMTTGDLYTVTVENVTNEAAEVISVAFNYAEFSGIGVDPYLSSTLVMGSQSISVSFSESMKPAGLSDTANYVLTSPISASQISVSTIQVFAAFVILTFNVEMTNGALYSLTVDGQFFQDLVGNAISTGDSLQFIGFGTLPEMSSATLEANGRLTVEFNEDMSDDSALVSKYNYLVEPTTAGAAVFVKSVKRINARTVSIEISETTNGTNYVVVAENVRDVAKNPINASADSAAFVGAGASPKVSLVRAIGPNRVDVTFSEEMMDNDDLRDPSHYSFNGGLIVLSATPDPSDARVVALVTSAWTPNTEYTLTITP